MSSCRFLKRYNTVVLDVAAVGKERSRLEQENADLRQLLKAFLDGIRCVGMFRAQGCQLQRGPTLPCVAALRTCCVQELPVCDTGAPGPGRGPRTTVARRMHDAGRGLSLAACSVNEAVLTSPTNPLLVVNQHLQQTMTQQRKQRTAGQQSAAPNLMLSGVAAGTGPAGLGSPKGGSGAAAALAAAIGPLSGRSVLSASPVGVAGAGAGQVAVSLLMSPRSTTAPASAARRSR